MAQNDPMRRGPESIQGPGGVWGHEWALKSLLLASSSVCWHPSFLRHRLSHLPRKPSPPSQVFGRSSTLLWVLGVGCGEADAWKWVGSSVLPAPRCPDRGHDQRGSLPIVSSENLGNLMN